MARSLNKVQLIGNLTRDPELRYTPNGAAVCSFSIATNRSWTTDTGEKREEVDFHRIVAWNKLAEICSQYLVKGKKTYVEGRLSTRNWTGQDGAQKTTTEVVIDDMILLDSKGGTTAVQPAQTIKSEKVVEENADEVKETQPSHKASAGEAKETKTAKKDKEEPKEEEVMPDDIPF